MSLTLQTLANYLKDFLKEPFVNDYCPNGLQIEGKEKIIKIGVAVSASLATIKEAIALNVDLLLVHHGLFWNKESFVISGPKREKIKLLLEHEISLIAYHLPLDLHEEVGNNWCAARDLGWRNLSTFNGIGVKGTFPEISIEEFIKKLETYYVHPATLALGGKKRVQSAALISGGAYKEIPYAKREGVDCYITGSFDEPAWSLAYEENINFLALGHTATERVGPRALGEHLTKKFGVQTHFIDTPNPF